MGALLGTNSGSPLDARAGGDWTIWIVLFLVLLVIIIGVFSIYKQVVKYKSSPAYLEKQKKRPTSKEDVSVISQESELSKEETSLLWEICKEHRTPNLRFAVKEIDEFDSVLKEKFQNYNESSDEQRKSILFALRRKLMKTYKQVPIIKNSKIIEEGTTFSYTVSKGFHHKLTLLENTPDGMVFGVPKSVEQMKEMPEALSKITLIFEAQDGAPYEIETRVMRFQTGKDDGKQIITMHTDKVVPLQKRLAERIELQLPCKFSSVKAKQVAGKTDYDVGEKEHDGTLEDVSTGGCRIITELAIKPEQYIFIKGAMNRKVEDSAIGQIVRTTKRADSVYVLHVRFLKIDLAVTNRIQAVAVGYDV